MTLKDRLAAWVTRGLGRLSITRGLQLAGGLGRLVYLITHRPAVSQVAALFPQLNEPVSRVAARIQVNHYRQLALIHREIDDVAAAIEILDPQHLREARATGRPVLVVFGHLGPYMVITGALRQMRESFMTVRSAPPPVPWPPELAQQYVRGPVGALALKGALDYLRRDKLVVTAIDGPFGGAALSLPWLGRIAKVQSGPAILQRLSQAIVIPAVGTWPKPGGKMQVRFFPPLPCPDHRLPKDVYLKELTSTCMRWLEEQLTEHPDHVAISTLRHYQSWASADQDVEDVDASAVSSAG